MKEYRLEESDIFVFGSNEIGKHSHGAALIAKKFYGAKTGKQGAFGFFGSSFAIPTKDDKIKPLSLSKIKKYVEQFIDFVKKNPNKIFYITPIGTGLAKFKHEEIAPMFKEIIFLENVKICPEWQKILKINK